MAEPRPAREPLEERSTVDLLRHVGDDLASLVRMETQLARQEIERSVSHAVQAVAAIAAASVFVVAGLVLIGIGAIDALDRVLPEWAAGFVVGAVTLALAFVAVGFARARFASASVVPPQARREVKEDIEWAKTRMRP